MKNGNISSFFGAVSKPSRRDDSTPRVSPRNGSSAKDESHATDGQLTVIISANSAANPASATSLCVDIPDPVDAKRGLLSCLIQLPMQINLVGANKYPVFEVRLGEVLTGLMNLSDLELTPQNYQILHGASLEVWHHALSSITLDETKLLKSADEAPSPEQILATLPIVDGEWRPGTYVELITPGPGALSLGDAKVFFYSGSGSGVGLGIAMRCGQHGSAAHRAHEKSKKTSFHYELVDQEGRDRQQHFRKTAVTEFRSKAAADINGTRALAIVNETVDMVWFRSFATHTHSRNKAFFDISPWKEASYFGANLTPSLRQDSHITVVDAKVLTPEEWKLRHRDQTRKFRENMDVGQKDRQIQYNELYNTKIAIPRNQMRKAGESDVEVGKFVQDRLEEIHEALPQRSRGSNRRRRPEDIKATPKPAAPSKTKVDRSTQQHPAQRNSESRWYTPRGQRCQRCKEKKERCDGEQPCGPCSKRGLVCMPQK